MARIEFITEIYNVWQPKSINLNNLGPEILNTIFEPELSSITQGVTILFILELQSLFIMVPKQYRLELKRLGIRSLMILKMLLL